MGGQIGPQADTESQHIRIGPEPVLTAHAPSPPVAATARHEKIQLPIAEQNFFLRQLPFFRLRQLRH